MILYEHTVPTAAIVAGVALAVAAGAAGYWLYTRRDWTMAVMITLRVLFFALLGWCLFLPGERTVRTMQQKSRFIVLLDASRSMTLTPVKDMTNRWQVAQAALRQPWVAALAERCDLDAYLFADDVGAKVPVGELLATTPEGSATLLRDALKKTAVRYAGLDVAGCLVLSDGLDTREAYRDWCQERRPFRLYTLALEKGAVWEEEPDVRVDAISTPRRVTVGWQTEFKTVISGQGTGGKPIAVQLFQGETLLQEQQTQLPAGGGAREVVFPVDHPVVGLNTFRVRVPPLPRESQTHDNESAVSVQVVDAKNRLMYVEGPPRWESKYLARVLIDSKGVNPSIFLRGPQGKFMTYGVRGDVAPDMQDAQLAFFKIVILGNLSGEELTQERAASLVKFVEAGGSLVLLGGSKAWGQDGFARTELKKLLPVRDVADKTVEGEFPARLTDPGRVHPAFAGDTAFWEKVPYVLSVFPRAVPGPAAQVLVEARTPGGAQPLIVAQNFGQGKVVAILTDSLWKWQLSPEALKHKPFTRFWGQLLSWMSPKEEQIEGKALELFVDREQCFMGEEIEITARWDTPEALPEGAGVNAEIVAPDQRKMPFAMTRQVDPPMGGRAVATFSVKFKGDMPGMFTVRATSDAGGRRTESDPLSFTVKPFTPEAAPRPADETALKALAVSSEGAYFESVEELDKVLGALEPRKLEQDVSEYRSLWQHGLSISCLVALVAVEWIIRKLRNMP
jgi:hypothetical protein